MSKGSRQRFALWSWAVVMAIGGLACGSGPEITTRYRYVVDSQAIDAKKQCDPDAPARKWAVVVGINDCQFRLEDLLINLRVPLRPLECEQPTPGHGSRT